MYPFQSKEKLLKDPLLPQSDSLVTNIFLNHLFFRSKIPYDYASRCRQGKSSGFTLVNSLRERKIILEHKDFDVKVAA